MSTDVVAVLIDDQEEDRKYYSDLLAGGSLVVKPLKPLGQIETVDEIEGELAESEASVVVLDYRLDESPDVRYRGGSLAAALRDRMGDVPLVLLTTETKLEGLEQRAGVEDLFDWRVLKSSVARDSDLIRSRLIDLAVTYWRLRADPVLCAVSGWERVALAMEASLGELEEVSRRDTFKPDHESPAQLGRWLLTRLLRHQGVLLDEAQARAVAGLTQNSFDDEAFQTLVDTCRYTGVLSRFGSLLWADRLRGLIADAVESQGSVDSAVRASALSGAAGQQLEPAGCVWCGSGRILRACSLCEEPVDVSHAIALLSEPLPAWAERPVACFRCIVDGRASADQLVSGAEQIIDDLVTGTLQSPLDNEVEPG